jgi:hypothetical protein
MEIKLNQQSAENHREKGEAKESFLERLSFRQTAFLFVPAYALHIIEEFPRFIEWSNKYPLIYGGKTTKEKFFIGDSLFIIFVVVSLFLLVKRPHSGGIVAALSIGVWALTNGSTHIALNLVSGVYSPGAISAAALYVPLFLLLLDRARLENLLTPSRLIASTILGISIQAFVLTLGHIAQFP